MSPPIPSNEPPTDVASLEPPALVSNFVLVFWSSRKLNRWPHSDWNHGLRMSRRVELLLVSDRSWLYEPHKNLTCGPFRKVRPDCAHVHAGKKIDARVVFGVLGGAFTKRWRICPSETACRCSHNASILRQTFVRRCQNLRQKSSAVVIFVADWLCEVGVVIARAGQKSCPVFSSDPTFEPRFTQRGSFSLRFWGSVGSVSALFLGEHRL